MPTDPLADYQGSGHSPAEAPTAPARLSAAEPFWSALLKSKVEFALGAALLVLGARLWVPVLDGYFLADDFTWIYDFYRFDWSRAGEVLLGNWSRAVYQEYRPLWAFSFAADLDLWGPNPLALHISNLAFHMVASTLVWRVARTTVGGDRRSGLVALAFFLLAPVHEQPVAWISARGHVLVTIFVLLSLLLVRRFYERSELRWYMGALATAVAALTTQELSVALPLLLLLHDTVLLPSHKRSIRRLILVHAPFWLLLIGYLALRLVAFDKLGRQDSASPLSQGVVILYLTLRAAWFSPTMLADVPSWVGHVILGITIAILVSPLLLLLGHHDSSMAKEKFVDYVRGTIYFAILWPIITVAPLMGAADQRHFYLASVGIAIALGLAGAHLAGTHSRFAVFTSSVVVLLLLTHGLLLMSGVEAFAKNGRLSREIEQQIGSVAANAENDPSAILVVIPEVPGNRRVFWDYALPLATDPLFVPGPKPPETVPSFTSCHCEPQEWLTRYGRALQDLTRGSSEPVYVVEWDAGRAAFATRLFDRAQFRAAGYTAPGGVLVRPRHPGGPTPVLPASTGVVSESIVVLSDTLIFPFSSSLSRRGDYRLTVASVIVKLSAKSPAFEAIYCAFNSVEETAYFMMPKVVLSSLAKYPASASSVFTA